MDIGYGARLFDFHIAKSNHNAHLEENENKD